MEPIKSEAERIETPPILLVILIPAVLGFMGPIWQLLISKFPYWIVGSLGESVCSIGMTTAPFFVLLLSAPFYRVKSLRERFGIKTLGYLYISSMATSYFINYPWALGQRYLFSTRLADPVAGAVIPSYMCPPADVCKVLATGGPIDWAAWATPMAWFWLSSVTMGLMFLSLATLFRRLWIDIENVPFPQTLVAYDLAKNNTLERGWGRMFMIGIIIGLAFEIPVVLTGLFPWFPDIYGVRANMCNAITRIFSSTDALSAIPGMMPMNYNPAILAIAYLAPLHILFSTWFFAIFYMAAVQIAYALGSYTGIAGVGSCGRTWCHPAPDSDAPLKFMPICMGVLLMVGIMHLVLNRSYIVETLGVARRGGSSGYEREAMSYRACYAMVAATLIAIIAFWMLSGMSFIGALFVPITAFCIWYSMARMYGLAGVY